MKINFEFIVKADSDDREFLKNALQALLELKQSPEYYGYSDPIDKEFSSSSIEEISSQNDQDIAFGVSLERKSSLSYYLDIRPNIREFHTLVGAFTVSKLNNSGIKEILEFFSVMINRLNIEYGFLTTQEELELRNYHEEEETYPSGFKIKNNVRRGIYYEEGYPGLYWINYFGENGSNYFGKSRLLDCPAFSVKEGGNGVIIQLYEKPEDYNNTDYEQAVGYLGADSFFSIRFPDRIIASKDVIGRK